MSDQQIDLLCKKIDNVANAIVIEGWVTTALLLIIFTAILTK